MSIGIDLIVGAAATYISRIDKQVNVTAVSIPIALPLGFLSAAGAGILMIALFKVGVFVLAILFFLVAKLKFLIGAKLVIIFGSVAATLMGIALGPIGWILISIAILIFASSLVYAIVDSFSAVYHWFLRKFADLLLWVRRMCDHTRSWLWKPFRPLVLIFEMPMVCGFSVYSLWEIMDFLGGELQFGQSGTFFRCVCLAPFVLFTYTTYMRDTSPLGDGGDGLDVPLLTLLTPAGD